MKKFLLELYADYLMSGYRAGDFEYKINDAPWIFSGLLTIQFCTLELLISNLFGFFNPEYGLLIFLVILFLSLIINYSCKIIFKRLFVQLKKDGELHLKVFYQNKFLLIYLLSLLSFFLVFYYSMAPYIK